MKKHKDTAKAGPFAEKADRKCDIAPGACSLFQGQLRQTKEKKGPFAPCEAETSRHRSSPE